MRRAQQESRRCARGSQNDLRTADEGGSGQITGRSKIRRRAARDARALLADNTTTQPLFQVESDMRAIYRRETGRAVSAGKSGAPRMITFATALLIDLSEFCRCGFQYGGSDWHKSMDLNYRCVCGFDISLPVGQRARLGRSGRHHHEHREHGRQQDKQPGDLSAPRSQLLSWYFAKHPSLSGDCTGTMAALLTQALMQINRSRPGND